jgi:hypothetical protein
MPVIQPYMTPRTYPATGLDTFTSYWAAFTTARTARHEAMMELMLEQMDDDSVSEMLDDLQRRRRSLERDMNYLSRNEITDVSRTERSGSSNFDEEHGRFVRHRLAIDQEVNRREQAYNDDQRRLDRDLRVERSEEADAYREFTDLVQQNESDAANTARQASGQTQSQSRRAAYRRARNTMANNATQEQLHARGIALYDQAMRNGHTGVLEQIEGDFFGGTSYDDITRRYRGRTNEEYLADYNEQMNQYAGYRSINPATIFTEAAEDVETYGQPSSGTDALRTSTEMYGTRREEIAAELASIDLQIEAARAGQLATRTLGLNAMQQMLSQNLNFAPFAFSIDESGQQFFDRVTEESPEKVSRFLEEIDMRGSPRAVGRAERAGRMDPVDFGRSPSTEDYAASLQGDYIFGHLHGNMRDVIEGLNEPGIMGAYTSAIQLTDATSYLLEIARFSENLTAIDRLEPIVASLVALGLQLPEGTSSRLSSLGFEPPEQAGFLQQQYERGSYRDSSDGEYRQYSTGEIYVIGGPQQLEADFGFRLVSESDVPPKVLTDLQNQQFSMSETDIDPERVQDIQAELTPIADLMQQGMGTGDVLFSEFMSESLMAATAYDSSLGLSEAAQNRRQFNAVHQLATRVEEIDRFFPELTGNMSQTLNNRMEIRSAEGNYSGLREDIQRMSDGSMDRADQEGPFEEYLIQNSEYLTPQGQPILSLPPADSRSVQQQIQDEQDYRGVRGMEGAGPIESEYQQELDETIAGRASAFGQLMEYAPSSSAPVNTLSDLMGGEMKLSRFNENNEIEYAPTDELLKYVRAVEESTNTDEVYNASEQIQRMLQEQREVTEAQLNQRQQENAQRTQEALLGVNEMRRAIIESAQEHGGIDPITNIRISYPEDGIYLIDDESGSTQERINQAAQDRYAYSEGYGSYDELIDDIEGIDLLNVLQSINTDMESLTRRNVEAGGYGRGREPADVVITDEPEGYDEMDRELMFAPNPDIGVEVVRESPGIKPIRRPTGEPGNL